jgi:hypothetical protein
VILRVSADARQGAPEDLVVQIDVREASDAELAESSRDSFNSAIGLHLLRVRGRRGRSLTDVAPVSEM